MADVHDGNEEPEPIPPVRQNLTAGMVDSVRARQRQEHGMAEVGPVVTLANHQRSEITIYSLGISADPDVILGDAKHLASSPVWGVRKLIIHVSTARVGSRDVWDEHEWILSNCDLHVALRALARFSQ
jgi:hypothetical protein